MDARTFSQFMLANATLVIDRQGQIRELAAGAVPAPGEVVVTVGDGANPQVTAEEVPGSEQGALNLNFDDEIAQIIGQLEQGADPTLNEDQATAAGGANGSALGNSGTVIMQLASLIAATAFSTSGYSRQSLSETQSLNEDLVEDEPPILSALEDEPPFIVQDENTPPYFVGTEYTTDDDDDDGNSFTPLIEPEGEDSIIAQYAFYYDENTPSGTVIGQVQAEDTDAGDSLEYSFVGEGYDFLEIDPNTGVITLVYDEDGDWKPNYEDMDNDFVIQVSVSDGINEPVIADVKLFERNVNEAPQAENFTINVEGTDSIPIIFDTEFGADNDYISDEDVDYLATGPDLSDPYQDVITSQELYVVLTSLPESGTLWYTEGDNDPVEIKQADIDNGNQFDPNNISYLPDDGVFTLNSDNAESVLTGWHHDKEANVKFLTANGSTNSGTGYGVAEGEGGGAGGGINKFETLSVNLSENELETVTFSLQGINPSEHGATVYFSVLADGETEPTTVEMQYTTDSEGTYYDEATNTLTISYKADDGTTIVGVDFTTTTTGSNYVVSSFGGEEPAVDEDQNFTYYVVDSMGAESEEKTVTLDYVNQTISPDEETNNVSATLGNETLEGDEQANVFIWLDNVLDNSTDTVKNFEVGKDSLEIGSILTEDSTSDDIEVLLDSGKLQVGNDADSVTLSVESNDGEMQVVVIEDVDMSLYDTGGGFDATAFLNDVLKTNEPV